MSSAGAIKAGRAFVELFADRSKLVGGLKAAESDVRKFGMSVAGIGAGMMGAGAAVLGPLLAASKVFADYGSELADASARTGIAASALSELRYAAEQTGTDMATVETGSKRLSKAISEAAGGSKEAAKSFAALGIPLEELKRLSPEEQFTRVAKAVEMTDELNRAAVAMDLFGKSGTDLLPMIYSLDELRQKARDLGLTMSDEDAAAADELGDAMDTLMASVKRATMALGAAMAPALTKILDVMTTVVSEISKYIDQNREMVTVVALVAVGLTALGAILVATGTLVAMVGIAVSGLTVAFGFLATAASVAWGAVTAPVSLTIMAIAGLVAALVYFSGAGTVAINAIRDAFKEVSQAINDVILALSGGKVDAAIVLMSTNIRLALLKIELQLASMFDDIPLLAQMAGNLAGGLKNRINFEINALTFARDQIVKQLEKAQADKGKPPVPGIGNGALLQKVSVSGTFNPAAIGGMFGGAERHLVDIAREMRISNNMQRKLMEEVRKAAAKMARVGGLNWDE